MPNTLDARFTKDTIAKVVADKWVTWNANRSTWLDDKKELRDYLFATDTRKTTNSKLPWKNSTVTPKLTQIRDNLHANYLAALFPNDNWFEWQAADNDSVSKDKRDTIENYMRTKLNASQFDLMVSQLINDYIDYGNVFAAHEYVCEKKIDPMTGQELVVYSGPKAFRISPLDIVFDPTASSFDKSPCIVRRLKSLGELEQDLAYRPHLNYDPSTLAKVKDVRTQALDIAEAFKSEGMEVDGFGSITQYFSSGMVELLDFWGDLYDIATGTVLTDQIITVADRRWVLRNEPNRSWTGSRPIKHCGWRLRPDNLWAQGPLDQLVGMQYRIDHLENLKADVFDQIAHPVVKVRGSTVEDFTFGPGEVIYLGSDGDVSIERPDAAALGADMQIDILMNRMEELAGAPRQAMGIRTPGEKTKYEVQVLENGAGRIFQSKVNWFERNVIEPLLNSMLEEATRSMSGKDTIRKVDPDFGTEEFVDITKADITAKGKLYPVGARHFAEEAKFVQELTQTLQTVQNLPTVAPHISGKNAAKALEDALGWKRYKIFKENVAVVEQAETQRLVQTAQEQVQTEAGMPAELQDADYEAPEGMEQVPPKQDPAAELAAMKLAMPPEGEE